MMAGFDGGVAGFGTGDGFAGADGGFAVADGFEPLDGAVISVLDAGEGLKDARFVLHRVVLEHVEREACESGFDIVGVGVIDLQREEEFARGEAAGFAVDARDDFVAESGVQCAGGIYGIVEQFDELRRAEIVGYVGGDQESADGCHV